MEVTVASVTASRSMKVNVGNYESYDIFNSITYSVSEPVDMVELSKRAEADLNNLQALEMNRAYDILDARKIKVGLVVDFVALGSDN